MTKGLCRWYEHVNEISYTYGNKQKKTDDKVHLGVVAFLNQSRAF